MAHTPNLEYMVTCRLYTVLYVLRKFAGLANVVTTRIIFEIVLMVPEFVQKEKEQKQILP